MPPPCEVLLRSNVTLMIKKLVIFQPAGGRYHPLKHLIPGVPKKVHKFKIIYLCSENRQITKYCVIC